MSKSTNYTLLIVCEGEKTEPLYFNGIRDEILESEALWPEGITISILPEPIVVEPELNRVVRHKTPRKRRQIVGQLDQVIEGSPPLKYIKKGQEELATGAFNEVWAVFDHDDHPTLKEAFELSEKEIDNKRVQIAFSSKCFEHWILLHFEQNNTPFDKSKCKEGKKVINCGTGQHKYDCHGAKCICGYLKASTYLDISTKSNFPLFPILKSRIYNAIQNAAWLRWRIGTTLPIYERNPYTNVDLLITHLLQIDNQIFYRSIGTEIDLDGILYATNIAEGKWSLVIKNVSNTTKILPKGVTKLFESDEELFTSVRFLIEPNESKELSFAGFSIINENYLIEISRNGKTVYFMFT